LAHLISVITAKKIFPLTLKSTFKIHSHEIRRFKKRLQRVNRKTMACVC